MLVKLNKKYPKIKEMLLRPFLIKINPNIISSLALVAALISGWLFINDIIFLAGIFILLNGFFDILDGEIARKYRLATKKGDFLDHVLDRVSDIVIILGLSFSSYVPDWLGYATIIIVLLVSYLGTESKSMIGGRLYSGIIGRADRLIIIVLGCFLFPFVNFIEYSLWLIFILSIITFVQRFWIIYRNI